MVVDSPPTPSVFSPALPSQLLDAVVAIASGVGIGVVAGGVSESTRHRRHAVIFNSDEHLPHYKLWPNLVHLSLQSGGLKLFIRSTQLLLFPLVIIECFVASLDEHMSASDP